RRRFNASPNIVGQTVALGGRVYTIAGVLPASFVFGFLGNKIDVWIPRLDEFTLIDNEHLKSGVCYLYGIARLGPGVSITKAEAQMHVIDRQYVQEYAKYPDASRLTQVDPMQERLVGSLRPT